MDWTRYDMAYWWMFIPLQYMIICRITLSFLHFLDSG